MESKQEFYRPEGPKVDPLAIPKAEITSELSELADDKGLIKVQLDQEAVLPRIANGIYANFESGFRETYANAITACINAKEQFNASPRIEISVDKTTRLLEIKEVDSTGISYDTFKNIYAVVGRSGNFDGTKPGQFGFGRLCVSSDTECLTRGGWKHYSDLVKGELIATYNFSKQAVEYKPLKGVHIYDYTGNLIQLGATELLVTPEHRCVVNTRETHRIGGTGKRGWFGNHRTPTYEISKSDRVPRKIVWKETFKRAADLVTTDKIRVAAPHEYTANNGLGSTDLAALMGWIIAEGYYHKSKGRGLVSKGTTVIEIAQNEGPYANEIRETFSRLGIKWREYHSFTDTGTPRVQFRFSGPTAGKIRQVCPNKLLNRFLSELPHDELEAMLDTMLKGDGTVTKGGLNPDGYNRKGGTRYWIQKNQTNSDWFQIIALRLGYHSILTVKRDPGKAPINHIFLCDRTHYGLNPGHNRRNITEHAYSGTVWCPEVENGTWVARRNGVPSITGNSWTTLSDRMVLQTKYRTTDGKSGTFAVEGKNGLAFAILPDPSLDAYGTTVSMVLYDKIEPAKLIAYIQQVSQLSPVDTYFTIADDPTNNHRKLNRSLDDVMRDPEHFIDGWGHSHNNSSYDYTWSDIYVFKEPDFEVYAINVTEQYKDYKGRHIPDVAYDATKAVLLNLPIQTSIRLPFSRALIRILDERALAPTADRERLKEETEAAILERLRPRLQAHFSRFDVRSIDQFLALSLSDKSVLYSLGHGRIVLGSSGNESALLISQETRIFMGTLSRSRINVKGIDPTKRRYLEDLGTLLTFYAKDEMFTDATYTKRKLDTLRLAVPRAVILLEDYNLTGDNTKALLDQLKLRNAAQYIADNKLKLPTKPRGQRGFTVHKSRVYDGRPIEDTTTYTTADEVPADNLIRLTRKDTVTKYATILEKVNTKYTLAIAEDTTKGTALADFIAKVEAAKCVTSRGKLQVKDFLNYDEVYLTLGNDPKVAAEIYASDPRLVVMADEQDKLFELAMYLTNHDRKYTIALTPVQEFTNITHLTAYDFYSYYGYRVEDTPKRLWSMLRVYVAAADKQMAILMMYGLGKVKDEEFHTYLSKALAYARQSAAAI